jgi:hypothetical protein
MWGANRYSVGASIIVTARKLVFSSEAQLVDAAIHHLGSVSSPWGHVEWVTEWDYRNGKTDILVRCAGNVLVAIEAKLSRWQVACDQAYRNTAFATKTYVLLPEEVAPRAMRCVGHFEARQIGLCTISNSGISVLIEPPVVSPLMGWVTQLAHSTFDGLDDAETKSRCRRTERRCAA